MTWDEMRALSPLIHPAVNAGSWFGPHAGLQAGTPTTGLSIWMLGFLVAGFQEQAQKSRADVHNILMTY